MYQNFNAFQKGWGLKPRPFLWGLLIIVGFSFFGIPILVTSFAIEARDQCISCHTDISRMKAFIPKFPEPPEEEGEA